MIKYYFSIAAFLMSVVAFAQTTRQIDWIYSNPVHYSLNPGMVYQMIDVAPNGNVICSRLDSSYVAYDQNVFGTTFVECLDPAANLLWSYKLSDSMAVRFIQADANNDIYIAGKFLGTAQLNNTDTINNISVAPFSECEFIIKLSSTGALMWKKNVSLNMFFPLITSIACDHQNNFWYCTSDFMDSHMFRVNNTGDVVDSVVLINNKGVTALAFDDFGSAYICGSAEMGLMKIINSAHSTSLLQVPETYTMYIARLDTSFNVKWYYFGHDVTFQSPYLVKDGTGGVYFAGNLMDSVTWGNISFHQPLWSSSFFLTRADSSGNFLWGRSFPDTVTISGRITIDSPGKFLTTDLSSNVYLIGTLNGSVNWGNNVQHTDTLGYEKVHVVAFDKNNTPLWEKTGGGIGNYPTGVAVSNQSDVYVTSAVIGTTTFDTTTVNAGGQLACAVVKITTSSAVSTAEIVREVSRIYPSPATTYLQLPAEWLGENIFIYDSSGRLIRKTKTDSGRIAVTDLVSGIYLMRCGTMSSRFTIIH